MYDGGGGDDDDDDEDDDVTGGDEDASTYVFVCICHLFWVGTDTGKM